MSIEKKDIIEYFDLHASHWDEELIRNDNIIEKILDNAEVCEGKTVLDVATGTGVLINDYLSRNVSSICAIDISPEMVSICHSKFPEVDIICGDADEENYPRSFDCIMIYNAFPHFPDPEKLIPHLSKYLNEGGTLTVAHGMSREKIDSHHKGVANKVSLGLMDENQLEKIFSKYLKVIIKISDDEMYQVTGKKI